MPIDQQVTLLRVLQERNITRIGGDQVIPVDVRVICATNKNLADEVKKGNFREDLYYRLNVILVSVPPLRERKDDISLLFYYLIKKIAEKMHTQIDNVQPGIIECLQNYSWPGNVRELENVVEKMINSASGTVLYFEDLPPEIARMQSLPEYSDKVSSWSSPIVEPGDGRGGMTALLTEHNTIIELLARYEGNISRVAKEMGVSRNTIYRKMKFYNISRGYNFE